TGDGHAIKVKGRCGSENWGDPRLRSQSPASLPTLRQPKPVAPGRRNRQDEHRVRDSGRKHLSRKHLVGADRNVVHESNRTFFPRERFADYCSLVGVQFIIILLSIVRFFPRERIAQYRENASIGENPVLSENLLLASRRRLHGRDWPYLEQTTQCRFVPTPAWA